MAFRINPAGKRQVTLGEDLVFETILRDRGNAVADLTNAGANLTIYRYEPATDLLTITLSCDDPTSGAVYGTVPAQSLYDALSPGLYWYQLKVAQAGTVLVAEQGTLNVLGGSLGPSPSEGLYTVGEWVDLEASGVAYTLDKGWGCSPVGSLEFDGDGLLIGDGYLPGSGAVTSDWVDAGWQLNLSASVYLRVTVQSFSAPLDPTTYDPAAGIYAESETPIFEQDTDATMAPLTAVTVGPVESLSYQSPRETGTVVETSFQVLVEVFMVDGAPGVPA